MKHAKWLLVVLMALGVFGGGQASAQFEDAEEGDTPRVEKKKEAKEKKAKKDRGPKEGKARKEKKPASIIRGEYAIMVSVLKFDEAQQAKLTQALQTEKQAQADWNKANKAKMDELKKAAKDAKEAKDEAAGKKAREELKALETERKKISADREQAVAAILNETQKHEWAKFTYYRKQSGRFGRVNPKLDDAQKDKIRALCDQAMKDLAGATDDKAKKAIESKLREQIKETVLTAEQRESMAKRGGKEKADKADKAPKPRKEGKVRKPKKDKDDDMGEGEGEGDDEDAGLAPL